MEQYCPEQQVANYMHLEHLEPGVLDLDDEIDQQTKQKGEPTKSPKTGMTRG